VKAIDVMLNVVVPKSLEEEFVDRLLESPDLVRGFTSYPISGHGGRMATASVSERVRGRSDRVLFQIGMGRDDVEALLAQLRAAVPNPEIAWWVLPVEGFGRLL
jgi:hypothetical protein